MTQPKITEEAFARADELGMLGGRNYRRGLALFIQTTSDVAKAAQNIIVFETGEGFEELQSLILPDPKDPLEEIAATWVVDAKGFCAYLREALAKRGLQITPIEGSK